MRSIAKPEPLDTLEEDVRITEEDCAAQARIRERVSLPSATYLAWCSWLTRDWVSRCRDLHTEPFEL
jgi:hypothetical protein